MRRLRHYGARRHDAVHRASRFAAARRPLFLSSCNRGRVQSPRIVAYRLPATRSSFVLTSIRQSALRPLPTSFASLSTLSAIRTPMSGSRPYQDPQGCPFLPVVFSHWRASAQCRFPPLPWRSPRKFPPRQPCPESWSPRPVRSCTIPGRPGRHPRARLAAARRHPHRLRVHPR